MFPDPSLAFTSLEELEETLELLIKHEKGPFILKLERQPGQKECRYNHLFSEDPYACAEEKKEQEQKIQMPSPELIERITAMEQKIEELTSIVNALKEQMDILVGNG